MSSPARPRPTPCASCPYRDNAPSGVWHEDEYAKLERYDGDIAQQSAQAVFACHQGSGEVCSGWLGHRDPTELLAVRLALIEGRIDPSCAQYRTSVPLFESGAAAAAHGVRDISAPAARARSAIEKIVKVCPVGGDPVRED